MTTVQREGLLNSWARPSSDAEQVRQERAVRMITDAMNAHAAFNGVSLLVYAKGSYANNTNVRLDSDVDVVVECQEVLYWDFMPGVVSTTAAPTQYIGPWTPAALREEVCRALVSYFGDSEVDRSGQVAILVKERSGSRPSADVVPSFSYIEYSDGTRTVGHEGTRVYTKNGTPIDNYPDLQLVNGRWKNNATNQRYKKFVRVMKNAENALAEQGRIKALPSYFMECLMWNVPNHVMTGGSMSGDFRDVLVWLWDMLDADKLNDMQWLEPNNRKLLFWAGNNWTAQQARDFVQATWTYLEYE